MSTIVKLHWTEFEKCAKTKNSIWKLMVKTKTCFLKICHPNKILNPVSKAVKSTFCSFKIIHWEHTSKQHHSVLKKSWIDDPYLEQKLPQHESLYPIHRSKLSKNCNQKLIFTNTYSFTVITFKLILLSKKQGPTEGRFLKLGQTY